MSSLRKDHLAYFLCICSPFVVVGALDFLWVGRTCFDYVSHDAIHRPFMHGMNFVYHKWSFPIHGGAGVASHIPVIFYSELAGIFIAAFGLSDLTMPALAVFGVAVDLVFVFIAAAWGAVLAGYCRIPAVLLLATSAIFATLPGLNFYWNGYYQIVALLVPVSLALIAMFDKDK